MFNTPLDVARRIAADVVDRVGTVCDPSCGTGAFLLAAGEALVALGCTRAEAAGLLHGIELDAAAARVARARVAEWSGGVEPSIRIGDALGIGLAAAGPWDHVVGNPPFVDGLHAGFLARAASWSSSIGLVLPVSVLATIEGRAARAAVVDAGLGVESVTMLGPVFDASVDTCAVVLRRGAPVPSGPTWSALVAGADVPEVVLGGGSLLGESCEVVAGFRQHFYGLRGAVREGGGGLPLVTSGAIEPGAWGGVPVRFDGVRYAEPRVTLADVGDASVRSWFESLLRPKVVVATQTRVIEAAADPRGEVVPSVPVLSVVPADAARLWHVLAVLLAPPVSAWAIRSWGGAALGAGALKLGCGQVRAVPMPCASAGRAAWDRAARVLRDDGDVVGAGALMCDAYEVSREVHAWWADRLR